MTQKIIINKDDALIRIAVMEDTALEELIIEKTDKQTIQGNIYKGKVAAVLPGLDSAFVDIGLGKNAFLHSSDVVFPHPDLMGEKKRSEEKKYYGRKPKIQEIFKEGQEIMVQINKEPYRTKGPRVTTNISLPGRFLVFLPISKNGVGISRKIEDRTERQRLRKILNSITRNKNNFIIRTAALHIDEDDLKKDIVYLKKQWISILRKFRKSRSPSLLHTDLGIVEQIIRDIYNTEIKEIIVDDYQETLQIRKVLKNMNNNHKTNVIYYKGVNVFEQYGVEKQIQKALNKNIWLKSGGHIVIDETEALTTIDVNTGKFIGKKDNQETILKTNMEACDQIAKQLRLRNVGGIIVVDFIDMKSKTNKEKVLNELKNKLKKDRAKTKVYGLSELGVIELTRQRLRHSLKTLLTRPCHYCSGNGHILSESTIWHKMKYHIISKVQELLPQHQKNILEIIIHPDLFNYIAEDIPYFINKIKRQFKIKIEFKIDDKLHIEKFRVNSISVPVTSLSTK